MKREIKGDIEGIKYSVDESIVTRHKDVHNVDAIQEIEQALKKFKETERERLKNAS
jgi:hypothetical protein